MYAFQFGNNLAFGAKYFLLLSLRASAEDRIVTDGSCLRAELLKQSPNNR